MSIFNHRTRSRRLSRTYGLGRKVSGLTFTGDTWVATRTENVDKAHRAALDANFVLDAYIADTKPRKFRLDGQEYDLANFAIITASQLGWTGTVGTFYRRLDQCLVDAGLRIKDFAPRRTSSRNPAGHGHLPTAIREIEG
jgi:hypothetical protein